MYKWSPSKTFNSTFERVKVPSPDVLCDRISESFKQSNVEFLVVIVSHGGLIDYGNKTKVRQPMFKTGCNVIYPNRYGTSLITYGSTLKMVHAICDNLPVTNADFGSAINGERLIESFKRNKKIKQTCYRQYDVGGNVPNLEIFSPGEYFKGDGIYLFTMDDRTYIKLNEQHIKQLKLRRIKKDLIKIPTKKKARMNQKPRYRMSSKFKTNTKQPPEQPLTLSDLCDANHGTLQNLRINGKSIPMSNTAVLVLACRNIDGTSDGYPVESPMSAKYESDHAMGVVPMAVHEYTSTDHWPFGGHGEFKADELDDDKSWFS